MPNTIEVSRALYKEVMEIMFKPPHNAASMHAVLSYMRGFLFQGVEMYVVPNISTMGTAMVTIIEQFLKQLQEEVLADPAFGSYDYRAFVEKAMEAAWVISRTNIRSDPNIVLLEDTDDKLVIDLDATNQNFEQQEMDGVLVMVGKPLEKGTVH